MFPKFLVYCKNDPAKTFFFGGVDGLLFDDADDMEIHATNKGRIFKKAKGKKSNAISQAAIESVEVEIV